MVNERKLDWLFGILSGLKKAGSGVEAAPIRADTCLIGQAGLLNSLELVELCLALEDKADALGFQFDWTSDKAMSEHAGMFRTVESLAAEFDRQWHMAGSAGSSDGAGGQR